MLTLYARREPTADPVYKLHVPAGRATDVVIYSDPNGAEVKARWAWDQHPPRRGQKSVTLNCYRWALVWLN